MICTRYQLRVFTKCSCLLQDIPDEVFDLYCWIHSTYTIPRALSLHVGREVTVAVLGLETVLCWQVAHPGVMTSAHDQEDERRYVTYYQWVGFTLFFQVMRAGSIVKRRF